MNTTDVEQVIESMDGWCSAERARAMMQLIDEERPSLCVEIGVFGGRSLVAMADACRQLGEGHVYGIDPWDADAALDSVEEEENIAWWSKLDYEQLYLRCLENVRTMKLESYVTIARTTSEHAAALFAPESVDVMHIDGNHSEAVSSRDVLLFLPLVRPLGHVWFDDMDWRSTRNAVRLLREQCDQVGAVGTCGLFKKRAP